MTLYIDLPATLHRLVAPDRMQSEMRVTTAKGTVLAFERWAWPDASRVQTVLRELLMEAVEAPGEHSHTRPLEVRAELHAAQPILALRVKFTPALGRLMVVSYRPKQVWADAGSLSPDITF